MKVAASSDGLVSGSGSTCTVDLSGCAGDTSPLWENETSLSGTVTEAHYLETFGEMCVVNLSTGEQVAWPVVEEANWWCGEVSVPSYESDVVYHHTDHLTGSNVDTDDMGNVLQLLDYYPYGDVRLDEQSSSYENDYKFTGKEKDEDTGLYYYEARYYDSGIGRFISLDPWFGDISDPQSLNKYAYVRNNPLKYVDPSGEEWYNPASWDVNWRTVGEGTVELGIGGLGVVGGASLTYGSSGIAAYAGVGAMYEGVHVGSVGLINIAKGFSGKDEDPVPLFMTTSVIPNGETLAEIKQQLNESPEQSLNITQNNYQNSVFIGPIQPPVYGPQLPESEFYTVQKGDTLSGIFGSDWNQVAEYNNLDNPSLINPGQKIRVPESLKEGSDKDDKND